MSIRPTSIFSRAFRAKFNAHKYSAHTSETFNPREDVNASQIWAYRVIWRGVLTVFLSYNFFSFFAKGHFGTEAYGRDLYHEPRSLTYRRLPKAERAFYEDFHHTLHQEMAFQDFARAIELM